MANEMPKLNLFQISQGNTTGLVQRYNNFLLQLTDSRKSIWESFCNQIIKKLQVSINMRPHVLVNFLCNSTYLNVYESVEEKVSISRENVKDILRELLGDYYLRRIAFDGSFDDGHRFRYGALNIGGVGATQYGTFCTVLNLGFPEKNGQIAYIKHDSLNGYTDTAGNFNRDLFQEDVAPQSHCQYLATLKHADEIIEQEGKWSTMLFSNDDYIEAIFIAPLSPNDIDEVRITQQEYNQIWELCFNSYSKKLTDPQKAHANNFLQILLANRRNRITLSVVNDD